MPGPLIPSCSGAGLRRAGLLLTLLVGSIGAGILWVTAHDWVLVFSTVGDRIGQWLGLAWYLGVLAGYLVATDGDRVLAPIRRWWVAEVAYKNAYLAERRMKKGGGEKNATETETPTRIPQGLEPPTAP